jgi:hypothetical protein
MKNLNKLTRGIVLLSLLAFVGVVGCSDTGTETGSSVDMIRIADASNLTSGDTTYNTTCISCHGADGTGRGGVNDIMVGTDPGQYPDFDALVAKIDSFMPTSNPALCQGDCARDVAAHVMCAYNQGLAAGCPAL